MVASFFAGVLVASKGERDLYQSVAARSHPDADARQGGGNHRWRKLVGTDSTRTPGSPFAVPRVAIKDMRFARFDEELNVTLEAREILRISDRQATSLREIATKFLPDYRASQRQRTRKASDPRHAYEITPAGDEEAATMSNKFARATAEVVGEETARQLPFPIKINTGNHFIVFQVVKGGDPDNVRITVGDIEREGDAIFRQTFNEDFQIKPGELPPERWRHVLALEEISGEYLRR